ncbi:MAG: hypothetical protein IJ688_06620 [Treponema sp.]|nr:hypothetical protein [Treponema sp.]
MLVKTYNKILFFFSAEGIAKCCRGKKCIKKAPEMALYQITLSKLGLPVDWQVHASACAVCHANCVSLSKNFDVKL